MEDANGGLYVPKGFVLTTRKKNKTVDDFKGRKMGGCWQKGTRNNTVVYGFVSVFQYFKRKLNGGCDSVNFLISMKNPRPPTRYF